MYRLLQLDFNLWSTSMASQEYVHCVQVTNQFWCFSCCNKWLPSKSLAELSPLPSTTPETTDHEDHEDHNERMERHNDRGYHNHRQPKINHLYINDNWSYTKVYLMSHQPGSIVNQPRARSFIWQHPAFTNSTKMILSILIVSTPSWIMTVSIVVFPGSPSSALPKNCLKFFQNWSLP